ncbi:DUF3108 domain-containing protein [Trinickia sp.]|uniref:DUF3108 domain-containing protein n=1 Tax=Trinickia sp. TaxID=2571163 RepID=UPI003F7CEC0D
MSYVFAPAARRTPCPPSRARRLARRWGAAFAAVLAVHGAALLWFARYHGAFEAEAVKAPIQVALLTPQPIERTEPQRGAHRTAPPRAHAAAHRSTDSRTAVLHAVNPGDTPPAAAQTASASQGDATSSVPGASSPGAASTAAPPVQASAASAGVRFSVPPSGNLHYNTFYNGVENAPGTIRWTSDGGRYEMVVSVPLPFLGTFSYESSGRIDAFGLAPERYVEKRGRRPEEVTTFDRAAKRIGFTRTSTTLALPEGAQDRFSMVMQLASLVRGDPETYKAGVTRAFYVADDDSGELWPIETIGDESIRTPEGFLAARHFMRLPRHDGDRRRIDVWLAPSLGWLPARIVQTEPNGTQIELLWRGRLEPPGAENATAKARTPDGSSNAEPADRTPAQVREQP